MRRGWRRLVPDTTAPATVLRRLRKLHFTGQAAGVATLIGSNLFNGLAIVGVAGTIHPIAVPPSEVTLTVAAGRHCAASAVTRPLRPDRANSRRPVIGALHRFCLGYARLLISIIMTINPETTHAAWHACPTGEVLRQLTETSLPSTLNSTTTSGVDAMILLQLAVYGPIFAIMCVVLYMMMGWFGVVSAIVAGVLMNLAESEETDRGEH